MGASEPPKKKADSLIGFLTVERVEEEDAFIAAWMVVDGRGYPLEFRATTPIKPSAVHRTLYGSGLEDYIGIELCGRQLVQQTKQKPDFILVPDERLLELATETDARVMAVWRLDEASRRATKGDEHGHGSIRSAGSPLLFSAARIKREDEGKALSELEACVAAFDPTEAFARMRSAIELLRKEDPRFT